MEPIIFNPDYKELVWGGTKLRTLFNKPIPYENTGESWEIASHKNGHSVVKDGRFKGLTLRELLVQHGDVVVGKKYGDRDKFPLLVKLIDAKADLSVQVHPDDLYAGLHEDGELGKSEAWLVLDVEPGGRLVIGLAEGVTKEKFREAVKNNTIESCLNQLQVKAGDVINIPAGLLHAIGSGVLLAEIQQNSDTTYRVYDWNRVGLDGKSRELHVAKSLDTIDFEDKHSTKPTKGSTVKFEGYGHTCYIINQYFSFETIDVASVYSDSREEAFEIFMVLDGDGVLKGKFGEVKVAKGDSLLIPITMNTYSFEGTMKLLKTYVPSDDKATLNRFVEKGFERGQIVNG